MSATGAAERLGIAVQTLEHWSGQGQRRFAPVIIEAEPVVTAKQSQWVVHGPCGLRIEGMEMEGLSELIRRLS